MWEVVKISEDIIDIRCYPDWGNNMNCCSGVFVLRTVGGLWVGCWWSENRRFGGVGRGLSFGGRNSEWCRQDSRLLPRRGVFEGDVWVDEF
jgi:hypothetical protein